MEKKQYLAIDLKSFYASVECVERGLDPLRTNLVVADGSRTEKTICLAVSPSLKAWGVPSRPRLFEVVSKVKAVNADRRWGAPGRRFSGATADDVLLRESPSLALDYITAPPRMGLYLDYSTRIYSIYLRHFAPEDIHVYSIDEVFIDASRYGTAYKKSARELGAEVVREIVTETGITATVGIGTNLYLAKVAMDIVAKRIKPDRDGVRIAELDEMSYRRLLWEHTPLTDFWRVGKGYEKKLLAHGIMTMGDVARTSLTNEALLYKLFGVNAELLIDHAWGFEPCTMEDVKAYRPSSESISSGQVLSEPYSFDRARLILREMCDLFALELTSRGVIARGVTLTVGYDRESLADSIGYTGEVVLDFYGREVPRHAHGTERLRHYTSSCCEISAAALSIFERVVDPSLLVRRITICATDILPASERISAETPRQLDIFGDLDRELLEEGEREREYKREMRRQNAVLSIKKKFGKNAILKGMNFEEGATTIDRNLQIGGHKA